MVESTNDAYIVWKRINWREGNGRMR